MVSQRQVKEYAWPVEVSTLSLPTSFPLQGQILPGWEVVQPLIVTLERDDDGSYLASDDKSVVYGLGDTPGEAMEDYIKSLTEYYRLIERETVAGNVHAQSHLDRIREYIRPVH